MYYIPVLQMEHGRDYMFHYLDLTLSDLEFHCTDSLITSFYKIIFNEIYIIKNYF